MKNLINVLLAIIFTATVALATTEPVTLLSNEVLEVEFSEDLSFFKKVDFDMDEQNLTFTTTTNISFIHIYNSSNEIEFQLPVMSDNVKINKNLFGEGTYKLGFLMKGEDKVHFTEVKMK